MYWISLNILNDHYYIDSTKRNPFCGYKAEVSFSPTEAAESVIFYIALKVLSVIFLYYYVVLAELAIILNLHLTPNTADAVSKNYLKMNDGVPFFNGKKYDVQRWS